MYGAQRLGVVAVVPPVACAALWLVGQALELIPTRAQQFQAEEMSRKDPKTEDLGTHGQPKRSRPGILQRSGYLVPDWEQCLTASVGLLLVLLGWFL